MVRAVKLSASSMYICYTCIYEHQDLQQFPSENEAVTEVLIQGTLDKEHFAYTVAPALYSLPF